jgi:hypothetical protein
VGLEVLIGTARSELENTHLNMPSEVACWPATEVAFVVCSYALECEFESLLDGVLGYELHRERMHTCCTATELKE